MREITEGHIVKRFDGELSHLRSLVLEMGGLVLDQIHLTVKAFNECDIKLALHVTKRDHVVNGLDVQADEEEYSILTRRAPVALDLRIIMSVAKAITDLEGIGDEADKIARVTKRIFASGKCSKVDKTLIDDVNTMTRFTTTQLRSCLTAFDQVNIDVAVGVAQADETLDQMYRSSMRNLAVAPKNTTGSTQVEQALDTVLIIKALETIGDHAKNIAEYVIYMLKGKDVRHVSPATLATEAYAN